MSRFAWFAAPVAASILHAACGGSSPPPTPPPDPASFAARPMGPDAVAACTLGRGFDSVSQGFRAECVRSVAVVTIPRAEGLLGILSGSEVARALGFLPLARSFFAVAADDARARFASSALANRFSLGETLASLTTLRAEGLDEGALEWLLPPEGSADWLQACGDEFVWRRAMGAQLFSLHRIDFASLEALAEWTADGPWSLWDWTPEAAERAARFAGRASVRVAVFQVGGDRRLLAGAMGDATVDSAGWELDCPMADPAPCAAFLREVTAYLAAQGPGSFAQSIGDAPVATYWAPQDWGLLGVNLPARPAISAPVVIARGDLWEALSQQLAIRDRIGALRAGTLAVPEALRAKLDLWEPAVEENLSLLADASRLCYEVLADPADAGQVEACQEAARIETLVTLGYDDTLDVAELEF